MHILWRIFDLEMEKVRKVRTLSFLQGTLINLLKRSILFILLWLIFRKTLTTGELISMQFILNTIFVPLRDLGRIILNYRESIVLDRNRGHRLRLLPSGGAVRS